MADPARRPGVIEAPVRGAVCPDRSVGEEGSLRARTSQLQRQSERGRLTVSVPGVLWRRRAVPQERRIYEYTRRSSSPDPHR